MCQQNCVYIIQISHPPPDLLTLLGGDYLQKIWMFESDLLFAVRSVDCHRYKIPFLFFTFISRVICLLDSDQSFDVFDTNRFLDRRMCFMSLLFS